MTDVTEADQQAFFEQVAEASAKAVWCALATVSGDEPRVRIVHPTWEGETLWFATGTGSPKHNQMESNANIDVQFQVAPPDFVHILVRGRAEIISDEFEKKRVWDVIDYDLSQFWSGGPTDPNYAPVRIDPGRVELWKMFGMTDKRVWRRSGGPR